MLDHTHSVRLDTLENIYDSKGKVVGKKGRTTSNQQHSHEVEILPDGTGKALSTNEHEHEITSTQQGGETVYHVSGPRACFAPACPTTASCDSRIARASKSPRALASAANGRTAASSRAARRQSAIWTFSGINESSLRKDENGAEVLPMELIVRVFRTYKGDIENGIQGIAQLRNPDETGWQVREE